MSIREIKGGEIVQGVDESIAYALTTTPWGSSPTVESVKAYDTTDGAYTDVSSTVLTGSAGVLGDVITCPLLHGLTLGHNYRLEVAFRILGNTFEAYARIKAER